MAKRWIVSAKEQRPRCGAAHRGVDANQSAPGGALWPASWWGRFLFLLIYALALGVIVSLGDDSLALMRRRTGTGLRAERPRIRACQPRKLAALSSLFSSLSSSRFRLTSTSRPLSAVSRTESRADSAGAVLIARFGRIQSTLTLAGGINRGHGIREGNVLA